MKITPINLAKRVERWQHRLAPLGISHFRITAVHLVEQTPGGSHAQASVHTPDHYDNAEFWFKWDFIDNCTADELDQTIIHEWLHVAMRDLDHSIEAVETWMPDQTYADFEETVDHEREGFVERLTRTIFKFYDEAK